MELKCKNCGAVMEVDETRKMAVCQYCGVSNYITPPKKKYKSQVYKQQKQVGNKLFRIGVVISVVVLLAGSGIAYFFSFTGGGGFKEWYSTGCLVNSNNDNVLDIVGLRGTPMNQNNIAVVDGKTGKIIKSIDNGKTESRPEIFCPTEDFIFSVNPDLTISILDPENLELLKTIALSDKIRNYSLEYNTVCINCYDNSTVAVDLTTLKTKKCEIGKEIYNYTPYYNLTSQQTHNGITYSASLKKGATNFIIITATTNKNDTLWTAPLRYISNSYTPCLVVSDQMVTTYGVRLDDKEHGYLVGLDKKNGMIRYEEKQSSTWSKNIYALYFNGKYIIGYWGAGLFAYEPDKGKLAWQIGGR